MMLTWIAFDADDTLWENELYYKHAQEELSQLLTPYQPAELIEQTLLDTETRNIPYYGYGIKSFGLSMIETALEISNGEIQGRDIRKILEIIREMVQIRVELLPGVYETLETLYPDYKLMMITKGDLLDQEHKLENSGLRDFFSVIEVVNHKDTHVYRRILKTHNIQPTEFLMIGNSLRSDVLPVSALGAHGVFLNHHISWEHENMVNPDLGSHQYYQLEQISELPALIEKINQEFKE
jgi:putative hydrolase of the HAD superfamily